MLTTPLHSVSLESKGVIGLIDSITSSSLRLVARRPAALLGILLH